MKRVISISLGSSERNHKVTTNILGTEFEIERVGTDGSIRAMSAKMKELDGKVDALGLGGMDLYLYAGKKKYTIREAEKIVKVVKKTPIVDGSGLKNTLERRALEHLKELGWEFKDKNVLMVCAMDRFGMAETFESLGCNMIYGDLIFSIGIPIKLYTLSSLHKLAKFLMPMVRYLPFKFLYPTGSKQNKTKSKYGDLFKWADIIAGDYHFIKKHMPKDLTGKIIITNTVTSKDVEVLEKLNLQCLVTTTPELNGRSFGTNVMEGVLVAIAEQFPLEEKQYEELLKKVGFKPRIISFQQFQNRRELSHG